MALTKKTLMVIGIILAVAGILSAITAVFYEFKAKPEMMKRKALVPAQSVVSSQQVKVQQVQPKGIGMEELTKYSKDLYGSDESVRREGSLWVDRNGKKFVVNLGVLNGLKVQDYLAVYDRDEKIGRVKIVSVLDVVSYAEPEGLIEGLMSKDYYRVEKE